MKHFTLIELAAFDGLEDRPAYVSYKGAIYDVSASFLWKGGRHQGLHRAGRDLTDQMARAPHEADFLDQYPIMGYLRS